MDHDTICKVQTKMYLMVVELFLSSLKEILPLQYSALAS